MSNIEEKNSEICLQELQEDILEIENETDSIESDSEEFDKYEGELAHEAFEQLGNRINFSNRTETSIRVAERATETGTYDLFLFLFLFSFPLSFLSSFLCVI